MFTNVCIYIHKYISHICIYTHMCVLSCLTYFQWKGIFWATPAPTMPSSKANRNGSVPAVGKWILKTSVSNFLTFTQGAHVHLILCCLLYHCLLIWHISKYLKIKWRQQKMMITHAWYYQLIRAIIWSPLIVVNSVLKLK